MYRLHESEAIDEAWNTSKIFPEKHSFDPKETNNFPKTLFFRSKLFFCNLPLKDEKNKILLGNRQTGPQIFFGVKKYQKGHNILFQSQ